MLALKLSILGPFQVMLGNKPVTHFASNKARALLTYLAEDPDRPYKREFLSDMFWPDSPRSSALGNLRYTIFCLRNALRDRHPHRGLSSHFITVQRDSLQYNIDSPTSVDVWEFSKLANFGKCSSPTINSLEQAITLYRGEFMEGFSQPDSPAFEEWLLFKREQYKRLMLKCLYCLAEFYEQQSDYQRSQGFAWRLVEMEPWLEEGYQQLMRTLALSGERSAALALFDTCRKLLSQELGVAPSQETVSLYEAIRDDPPWCLRRIPSTPVSLVSLPGVSYHPGDQPELQAAELPQFIGFERELLKLRSHLNQAVSGQGKVIFISGDPGTGKTSLAHELARQGKHLYDNLIVACGSGAAPLEYIDAYLPFAGMLHSLINDVPTSHSTWTGGIQLKRGSRSLNAFILHTLAEQGPELIVHLLSPQMLIERASSLGELETAHLIQRYSSNAPSHHHQEEISHTVFNQCCYVLNTISQRSPLLLIFDDMQWSDRASTNLLFHIARQIASSSILILVLFRPGELFLLEQQASHPLAQVVLELTREFGEVCIDLNNADGREFVKLCLDRSPNRYMDQFREEVFQITNGHPLFTIELLRSLRERGEIFQGPDGQWVSSENIDWDILPERTLALIAGLFSHLPEKWVRYLRVASVEGEQFIAELTAQLTGIEYKRAIHWLSGPLSRQLHLVRPAGFNRINRRTFSTYCFSHPLYQKYLYDQMDMAERAYLHEQSAQILCSMFPEPPDRIIKRINRHFQLAGLPKKIRHS